MKFQPGESGNPNGRPKGTGYRQQLFNELVLPRAQELIEKAITLALYGDEAMLRLLLERILPPKPHGEPINLELPDDLNSTPLLLRMGESVLKGIAHQDITPSQGKIILDLVEEQKRLVRIQERDNEFKSLLG